MNRRGFVVSSLTGIAGSIFGPAASALGRATGLKPDRGAAERFLSLGFPDESVSVNCQKNRVRYVSGRAVYTEELIGGRWTGRYWGVEGQGSLSNRLWTSDAFEIRIKTKPSPASVPGALVSAGWQWVTSSEMPQTKKGEHHFVVELSNSTYPLRLKIHTLLDGTPIMTRWLEITNTSAKSIALTALCPWSGRLWAGEAPISLGCSTKWQYPWEGWFGWRPLNIGKNVVKEERGLTADDPYFVLHSESNREYFFGQLGWPEKYVLEFEKKKGLSFKIGPTADHALRVLATEEMIETPTVHLGLIRGDFDSTVQAMHEHIRRSVLPSRNPERSNLIQYLIPEDWPMTVYHGEGYNETNMEKCIDVAAAVGAEMFILDGPLWCSVYGNWLVPDKKHFPNGLAPLVDYAHKRGLLFGLYFELEGGRDGYCSGGVCIGKWSESNVFEEHPNWFVQPHNIPILNLSLPDAASYMTSEFSRVIDYYELDLYWHDFNAPANWADSETNLRDGFMESGGWRHYEAFYHVLERIHSKYPDLILQQASGGGRRLDMGSIGRWHENFDSDRATYPFMYQMLSGLSVYLCPEILVGSNGMAWPKDLPDLDTILRGAYTLGTTPVIFNGILPRSVEEFKPEVRERFLHYAHIYKTFIRPLIPRCNVYHHAPVNETGGVESGEWFAMEFASPDRRKGWATIIRLCNTQTGAYLLKPKGLDARQRYKVTFDNTGSVQSFDGSKLIRDGMSIDLPADRVSELVLFEGTPETSPA